MGKRLGLLLATLAVALFSAGCVTRSSHTEGDREVNDQQKKAGEVIVEANSQAAAALDAGDTTKAKSLLQLGAEAGAEVVKNAKQQEGVHGAPENPNLPPFSPANSEAARKKSDQDHTSGKWVMVGLSILSAAGSVAVTLLGMPWLAQVFPALTGKIGQMAKAGVETINSVRAVAEANGGNVDLKTVLAIAKDKNVSHGVQDIVAIHAHAHEEAMGHNLTSLETIKDADGDGMPDEEPVPAPAAP